MVSYDFVYELMRAYRDSNLLVNKRVVGGKVKEFLEIPDSYRQVVIDENGNKTFYQYVEFKIPFYLKSEKALSKYLKKIEENVFKNSLLQISDEEIENFNRYWNLEFVGLIGSLENKNCAGIVKPSGEQVYVSLQKGKRLPDVYEILFKPLAYF